MNRSVVVNPKFVPNYVNQARSNNQMDKSSKKDSNFDKLRNIIIQPQQISKPNMQDINNRYDTRLRSFDVERREYEQKRTNMPYKTIIKSADTTKIKKQEDLLIHKVTEKDKEGVDEQYNHIIETIRTQDGENKILYAASKQSEHKEKFEYNNKTKYKVRYNPKDYTDMKSDQVEYYKEEQRKLEQDKKKYDDILENLLEEGVINHDNILDLDNLDTSKPNSAEKNVKTSSSSRVNSSSSDDIEIITTGGKREADILDQINESTKNKYKDRQK